MNKNLFGKGRWLFATIFCLFFANTLSFASTFKSQLAVAVGSTLYLKTEPTLVQKTVTLNQVQSKQVQTVVTGTVTDATGSLPGVTVTVKGTPTSTITDNGGKYSINAKTGDILIFSYVGYKEVSVTVSVSTVINVTMQEDATTLQEVKINAGYYSVKESESTGSIARVTAATIEKQPVTDVLAAMQGRMSGVNITQTTGVPGGGFDIQIRGINSLRADGNQPLYIIDGMTFSSQSLGNTAISGPILPGAGVSPLNNINPSDIESIEILKDADATSIYGSRGANGVVLITTKKGKKGKTQFSFNTYTGVGSISRRLELLNTPQYLEMREEAFANDGIDPIPDWAYDMNGTWDKNRYTDWQDELIGGTSNTRNIEAGVSGGSCTTQFLIRGTLYNETSVFPGDFNYGKGAFHFNVNHTSEDNRFGVNLSGNYVAVKNNLPSIDLTRTAVTLAPNAPALYDENGDLNWENSTWDNPLRLLEGKYLAKTKGLNIGGLLFYKLLTNLELKATMGYVDSRLDESSTAPSTIYNPAYGLNSSVSSAMVNNSDQQSWSFEPQLNWEKTIGSGKLDLLVGATFQESTAAQFAVYASGFSSNSLITNMAAASFTQIMNDSDLMYRYTAVFGRANYSLNGKYFLNLTGRRDGSSRFGSGNQFANFGAVGVAWLFGRESWVENSISFLSFGKLRSSYGTTGSDQIGDYQFLNTYIPSGTTYQGMTGLEPARLYNPNFSWEINKKFEVALELGFLNDNVFLTTAYYNNRSSNQLVGVPLPGTTGFNSIQANLDANVENSGLEFDLRTVNFNRDHFKWKTSLNLTFSKTELLSFPNLEGSVYANQYVIGESLSIRKVYEYTGINSTTGLYEFRDFNGDGLLTANEDREKIVDTSPEYFGGLQNSLTYKNWQFDFFFQFVKQLGINSNATSDLPGSASNMPVDVLDRWQEIGDTGSVQVYTAGFNGDAVNAFYTYYTSSDAAYSDASYVRLKNVSLSYTLPDSWLQDVRCKFYFQGQNLLTFTQFKGADPENQSQGRLPTLRILAVGVQLNF
jgi:TonB-linked SusC/RagA family outer membrane protein